MFKNSKLFTETISPPDPVSVEEALLKRNMDATYAEMHKNLNTSLYGDGVVTYSRPTWRTRLANLRWRISCAWLVLIGKADIG